MAEDRSASFNVAFDGKTGTLQAFLGALKKDFRTTVADMNATADTLQLFNKAQSDAAKASEAFDNARRRVDALRQAVDAVKASGQDVGKGLATSMASAEKAFTSATRQLDRANVALENARNTQRLSVQTATLLAAEQAKVAAQYGNVANAAKLAANAEAERQAKAALGLKTLKDIAPEIQKLNLAYKTLAASGTLSTRELAAAQQQLRDKTAELRAQVTGLGQAAKAGTPSLVAMFKDSVLPALGLTATLATVVAGLNAAIDSARQYSQRIAEIGTITNLTKDQLDELGLGARALAQELGVDVDAALRGIFELIRSGVPADNAIEVLRISAVAAKASLTDLGDGVKAADALISGFGASVGELGPLLDAVVVGAKNGGATLKEFGENAGPLLAVARAAKVPFNELLATLTVMVDATGNAGQSFSDLTKIIRQINTAEARQKLRDLGIEGTSLVDIFRQIGERGLALDQILELGVASTRSAVGVAALTSNASQLPEQLDRIATSTGAAAKGVADLFDTPRERAARFNAALNEASINIGSLVGSGSRLAQVGTLIAGRFNEMFATFREVTRAATEQNASIESVVRAYLDLNPLATEAARAQQQLATAAQATAVSNDEMAASLERANTALRDFAPQLLASITAIQQASARDITDANARADAQIAALDRSAAATRKTAAETLEIQRKLSEDRLAIIVKEEADVITALEKAVAAQAVIARKSGVDEKKIAQDAAQARLSALAPILAQYQAHYNALVAQAQGHAATLRSIENERLNFNRGIEKTLFDIRVGALSVFDQYVAKAKEAERLVSLAREAGAKGDLQKARQYTEEAIALANSLGAVTNERGIQIVTALQAQADKQRLVTLAANGYNDALDDQAQAAKAGAIATNEGLDAVIPKLNELRQTYDGLKATIAEGLDVKVQMDSASVAAAFSTLEELSKPRETTLTVRVRRVEENSAGGPVGATGFARGGPVGRLVQAFARGGPVFRRPSWSKVPGSGSGDTVPAALQEGSFVVRKEASRRLGDPFMRALALARMPARHFARGGRVKTRWDDIEDMPRTGSFTAGGVEESGFFGDIKAGTQESQRDFDADIFGEPELPKDPRALERKILQYRDEVIVKARQVDGSQYWGPALRAMAIDQKDYEQRPTAEKLATILKRARGVGLNIGISSGTRQGFDVDGRRFHKKIARAPAGLGNPRLYSYDFFEAGGRALQAMKAAFSRGTDTVRAMLTPGEWVIQKPAVRAIERRFGRGTMNAINKGRAPQQLIHALRTPGPRIQHLAGGGQVGGEFGQNILQGGAGAGRILTPQSEVANRIFNITNNVSVTAAAASLLSQENVRRFIVPVLNDIMRGTGAKLDPT